VNGNVSWKAVAKEIAICYRPRIAGSLILSHGRRGRFFSDNAWEKMLKAKVGTG
jgi:hypothetical protein